MDHNFSTPHIKTEGPGFAKTVLMPGDPLRARFIATNFLEDPVLVNNVRGVNGYTGKYKGGSVSVMASGMGVPSIGIYSYELFSFFGVENIIRIGSAGAINRSLQLGDIVAGMGACTDSNFAAQFSLPGTFAPISSFSLLYLANRLAEERRLPLRVGNLLTTDVFYGGRGMEWEKMGVLAVEMESAALYMNAARLGKNALTLCTVSDKLFDSSSQLSSEERETSFVDMIALAMDMAVELDGDLR